MKFRKLALLFLSPIFTLGLSATTSTGAEVWFGAIEPAPRSPAQERKGTKAVSDYMDLFRHDAPWATAASGLKVLKISTAFGLHSTDAHLQTLIDDLKRRHIALAIELGMLEGCEQCGKGVEGYGAPKAVETLAKRIKRLGGQIDYVAMDEPVWYGHVFKQGSEGRVGCQYTVDKLAELVAVKVVILREIFPNVQVGDIDPISSRSPSEVDDLVRFADAYREKTHTPLAFVHADVAWRTDWQPLLEKLAEKMHKRGIRVGVVCNGDRTDAGNEAWITKALQRCRKIAANPKIKADDFVVQSWEPLPTKVLPETDPGALTFAAKQIEAMVSVPGS